MIEHCLPTVSRRFYIRVRAQKWEEAMVRHREQLTSLRREVVARSALPSGQDILAEWKLSEEFIGEMAVALVDATLETCEVYDIPLDLALSNCVEKAVEGYIEVQFRHALRNRNLSPPASQIPTNIKDVFAGRIRMASFHILNPIQIRLEKTRVTAERQAAKRESVTKENDGAMALELNSAEQSVLAALGESYPAKIHVQSLAAKLEGAVDFAALLQIVERLHTRRLVDCVPLKDFAGLKDAANIVLSAEGLRYLKEKPAQSNNPTQVTVVNVLISSPSDVQPERSAVEEAIQEWNNNHHQSTGIMLHPVRWETHAYPALGDRPQGILNKQIVRTAHFLIGIFGTRLGTPTGVAPSGTIEEIEEIRKSGKHVALYFSNAAVPRNVDREQLDALEKYQQSLRGEGVYFQFGSVEELRRLVINHLPKIVSEVRSTLGLHSEPTAAKQEAAPQSPVRRSPVARARGRFRGEASVELNPKEMELLWEASRSCDGEIYHSLTFDGEGLRANQRHFLVGADPRSASEWLSALRRLEEAELIEPLSEDRDLFRLTGEGYAAADGLEEFARWNTQSVTLRAYYMNADTQEQVVACKGVVSLPTVYYPDQISADNFVSRSVKEPRALLIEEVGANPHLDWTPTDVEFTDEETQKVETFRVQAMQFVRPNKIKLSLS